MDGRRWRAHLVYTGGVVASALTPMLERRIGRRWPQAGKAVVPAILAASAVGAEVLERRRPERRGWQPDPDDLGRDVGYLGFLATAGAVPALADALVSRGGSSTLRQQSAPDVAHPNPGRRRQLGAASASARRDRCDLSATAAPEADTTHMPRMLMASETCPNTSQPSTPAHISCR